MNTTIEYYTKSNYGTNSMYIKDLKVAQIITNLTNRKTITDSDMHELEKLGFTFTEVLAPKI